MTGDAPVENIGTDEWFAHDWSFVMNGCTSEQDAAPLNVDEVLPQVFLLVRSCIGKTDGA